jgi:cyclophilin family peptidyl-prolyl cis-trans isomerase
MTKTMNRAFCLTSILVSAASLLCAQAPRKSTAPTSRAAGRSLFDPKSLNQKAPETYKAKFTTTRGDFVVEATRAWAPAGADRFYNLVKNRFYDGSHFFRVLPGFVVQFGISPRPEVSKVWRAATIQDDPVKQSNLRGFVSFATSGPNTRTTQVFINLGDNSRLDGMGFSPFGHVIEGMDVVEKFYSDYGEGAPQGKGPEQGRIESEGKAYLEKDFPRLDSIKGAVIVSPAREPSHSAGPAKKTHAQEGSKP